MADDDLLDRLRAIAHEEGVSLGEVIREGMELRAQPGRPHVTSWASVVRDGAATVSPRKRATSARAALVALICDTGVVLAAIDEHYAYAALLAEPPKEP